MTNKKRKHMSELPTMQRVPAAEEITTTETAPILPSCELVSITIPFVAAPPIAAGHQDEAFRVDMGTLTKDRMRKVKALRRGFIASDTRMAGGYEVKTNRDAIFCLLDHLDI